MTSSLLDSDFICADVKPNSFMVSSSRPLGASLSALYNSSCFFALDLMAVLAGLLIADHLRVLEMLMALPCFRAGGNIAKSTSPIGWQ